MHKPVTTEEKELWQRRYEQLRQQASAQGEGLTVDAWGLGLLQRQGVVAWMQAWQDPARAKEICRPAESFSMQQSGCDRCEMTMLLANMALSHINP